MGGFVLQTVLVAGLLSLIVVIASRIFRLSPAVRFGLWLVVLIKLLVPPVVEWPWDATTIIPEPVTQAWFAQGSPPDSPLGVESPTIVGVTGSSVPAQAGSSADIESASSLPMGLIFLVIWLAGSLVVLLVQARRIWRFRGALSAADTAPNWIVEITGDVARQLGIGRPPVHVVEALGSPIVWSLGRPTIVIPEALLTNQDAGFWRCVLAHELAHIRRRDHWFVWLEFAGSIVWWWNPLYWLVRHRLRTNAEMAADSCAVSLDPDNRRTYAESLLRVTEWGSGLHRVTPALGATSRSRKQFGDRLATILRDEHNLGVRPLGRLAILLYALLSMPFWPLGEHDPEDVEERNEVVAEVVAQVVQETNIDSGQWRSGWYGFSGYDSPTSDIEAFVTLTPYALSASGQVVLPEETHWFVRASHIGARAQDDDDGLILVLMDPTHRHDQVIGFWPVIVEMPLSNVRKLHTDLADVIRTRPMTANEVEGMESSIYTGAYSMVEKRLYGEAQWKVMPRFESVDPDGEAAPVDNRIAVGLQDSVRNVWPVIVRMDSAVAQAFLADLAHVIEQKSEGG